MENQHFEKEDYEGKHSKYVEAINKYNTSLSDDDIAQKVGKLIDEKVEENNTEEVKKLLAEAGIRVETDERNEKIGFKIREANLRKIPVQLVIGKSEMEGKSVNVRRFGSQDSTTMELAKFIEMITEEAKIKFE